ncbi:glycosyl transferase family 2 [Hoeflea marina]|uniref:Glycosyl transferase family 2 n=1 Tax=Hoeflea marina TaxID=274592 RepID=A0A317PY83_9HYPH|nr:glycosyltransferase [Hoeflea marina]PWW04470.1 glycosyl transferase family 2 [Hoeflea marina]
MTRELLFGNVAAAAGDLDASYILYTWNQALYVAEAVRSALDQDGCVLDILISDDASTDSTYDVILATLQGYQGPHRVRLRRSPGNMKMDHFPSLLRAAACDISIHAHGDDVALPHRAARILQAFRLTGASVVSSNAIILDAVGGQHGRLVEAARDRHFDAGDLLAKPWRLEMAGAFLALRREVYTRLPWLDSRYLARGHDHLVPWRGALLDGFFWIADPLLLHRMHEGQWRHRFYDNSGKLAQRETVQAQQLVIARAKRRDLDHLMATADEERRNALAEIGATLGEKVAQLSEQWLDLREDLIREGMRPHWTADDLPSGPPPRSRNLRRRIGILLRKVYSRR